MRSSGFPWPWNHERLARCFADHALNVRQTKRPVSMIIFRRTHHKQFNSGVPGFRHDFLVRSADTHTHSPEISRETAGDILQPALVIKTHIIINPTVERKDVQFHHVKQRRMQGHLIRHMDGEL